MKFLEDEIFTLFKRKALPFSSSSCQFSGEVHVMIMTFKLHPEDQGGTSGISRKCLNFAKLFKTVPIDGSIKHQPKITLEVMILVIKLFLALFVSDIQTFKRWFFYGENATKSTFTPILFYVFFTTNLILFPPISPTDEIFVINSTRTTVESLSDGCLEVALTEYVGVFSWLG